MSANANKTNNTANNSSAQGKGGDDQSVPHVVRVTFLGVAGLLAKPSHPQDRTIDGDTAGGPPITATSSANTTKTLSPASADHPSLLFPLPPNLRVVASVSRSRTTRGIPSGMSKCLTSPHTGSGGNSSPTGQTPPPLGLLSPLSTNAIAGSFSHSPVAGESILVSDNASQSNTSQSKRTNDKPLDEISVHRDPSTGLELFDKSDLSNGPSSAKLESVRPTLRSAGGREISPPSQLLNARTNSNRSRASRASGAGTPTAMLRRDNSESNPNEGIEVIRPCSPAEGMLGGRASPMSKSNSERENGNDIADTDAEEPKRYVAVWEEGGSMKPQQQQQQKKGQKNNSQQKPQHKFVNLTNSLAFEAELRPSSAQEGQGGRSTPVPSTNFAPKSFCVTLGLVPNFDPPLEEEGSRILDDLGESTSKLKEEGGATPPHPTFAIPVGFADLVINGNETLDGRRKQVDLPLSSLGNLIGSLPGTSIPLIELTADGLAGAVTTDKDNKNNKDGTPRTGKTKKKSIVKRMFSRKQQPSSSSATTSSGEGSKGRAPSPTEVYDGPNPQSVFQLGRPPSARERSLFLERYGIDPGGDAVVRIGLEVFPRGSELERIFRQKNRLRRKAAQQQMAAASATGGSRASGSRGGSGRKSPHTGLGSRDRSSGSGRFSPAPSAGSDRTTDSRSLMDDDECGSLGSGEDDSVFSQSFFTLDSDASHTTWDESTMYTDALSSFNTIDDDSMFTDYSKIKTKGSGSGGNKTITTGNFFTTLLNCNGPPSMTCGVSEDEEDAPKVTASASYTNIDTVAEAIASMSMADSKDEGTPRMAHHQQAADVIDSAASADTAPRKHNRPISPESMKESGEELTLDKLKPSSSRSSSRRAPAPIDTTPTLQASVTVDNEDTPLAMINTRFTHSQDMDENDERRRHLEEGHEFTLEEHESSM